MKAVVKELRSSFPTLLRSKRAGVISAALAAAVRTSTGQLDLSKALSAALRDLPGNQQVEFPISASVQDVFPSVRAISLIRVILFMRQCSQ